MKHLIRTIIWIVITVYLLTFALLRLTAVQTVLADSVSSALTEKLGAQVNIKSIDLRLFNRIIIDDFTLYDQHNRRMLRSGRLSATVDLMPLLDGKVSISSVQLFGIKANIYRNDAASPLNCQFVIDSLKSKDTTSSAPLDLHIASLVIRNGEITYDQWDKPQRKLAFSPYHVHLSNISSHISLHEITDTSANVSVKKLSFHELSGLKVKNFSTDIRFSKGSVRLSDFMLSMPKSEIHIPYVKATYAMNDSTIRRGSLKFNGKLDIKRFSPSDIKSLLPDRDLASLPSVTLSATAEGTDEEATSDITLSSLDSDSFILSLSANARDILNGIHADILINEISASSSFISQLGQVFSLPEQLKRAGDIRVSGKVRAFGHRHITAKATVSASNAGRLSFDSEYANKDIKATIKTSRLDIARIMNDNRLGHVSCDITLNATLDDRKKIASAAGKGEVREFTYNGYTYTDASVDITYQKYILDGKLTIHDPNLNLDFNGSVGIGKRKSINATIALNDFCPSALNLSQKFGADRFACYMEAAASGSNINDMTGDLTLRDVSISNANRAEDDAYLGNIEAHIAHTADGQKEMSLYSDFASLSLSGNFDIANIASSIKEIAAYHLPALKSSTSQHHDRSDFSFNVNIKNIDFIKRLVNVPVEFDAPIVANGYVNAALKNCNVTLSAPSLKFSNTELTNSELELWTTSSSLRGVLTSTLKEKSGLVSLSLECEAGDNELHTVASWDNMRENVFRGRINVLSQFLRGTDNRPHAIVSIPHSSFEVGDTVWTIHSRSINYSNEKLSVNHLAIENQHQHLYINGTASKSATDTITAELKDINIGYIMDLVNFHSVDFDGWASGTVHASSVMSSPVAKASLTVDDFQFEQGHLGNLLLDAGYEHTSGLISLTGGTPSLALDGGISPVHNSIDLQMNLNETQLGFMKSFCHSFSHDIDLNGSGDLRLHGPFNGLELEGRVVTSGALTLSSTNCRYTLENDTIDFVPGDIRFDNAILKDRFGNTARLSGGVHHRHLGRISYDLTARTKKFLAYDFPVLTGDDTYCGFARINGEIGIHGKGNELNISTDCTALPGTFFTYDASSPEALKSQDFITWGSANDSTLNRQNDDEEKRKKEEMEILDAGNDRTNIRLNFMINVTPESRLHLIMDRMTGDYVDLFGAGALQVQYYNKGSLDIFGNYGIDHGTYKMTIQNLMRRDFAFQKGGNITFTGDPYNAILNMQAAYMLNSVSLADLNIGSSFKTNNVPVNCLMDITGTPEKPQVTFGLDLPSLSSDARQMVYSVINSAEEMNQQVLYLLAVGRFLSQSDEEENTQRTKQSTLAMQSFLSGTLSQQLSNVLGQITGKTNWSLGANITPGADGFNNGVYEGLLSGRMFNNRLLFNGQFGYRDNINTDTQNFIGDFTLQYLLTPNGNFSLKMYNQSNDRYFTKSSLNTQGIGVVIQKEFGK